MSHSRKPRNLLVVKPDPLFRHLLCLALSDDVRRRGEGLITVQPFAAIVAEYHLRGGTGLELCNVARARGAGSSVPLDVCRFTLRASRPLFQLFLKAVQPQRTYGRR